MPYTISFRHISGPFQLYGAGRISWLNSEFCLGGLAIKITVYSGLIKGYSPDNTVKKTVSYIPYRG
jgi:hypothetical protein